jgi:hypothetical protein
VLFLGNLPCNRKRACLLLMHAFSVVCGTKCTTGGLCGAFCAADNRNSVHQKQSVIYDALSQNKCLRVKASNGQNKRCDCYYWVIPHQINEKINTFVPHHLRFSWNLVSRLDHMREQLPQFFKIFGQVMSELRVDELWPKRIDPLRSNACISGCMAPRRLIFVLF